MSRTVLLPPESAATANGVRTAGWWHESDDGTRVVCDLCPRGCAMNEGKRGFCFVRQNLHGELVTTTYGRSSGFCIDPIEKKPLNHFYPGSAVLSFGTAGCNLGCKFCQNWEISKSREIDALGQQADPETVAQAARLLGCRSVAFTYNDPVIWAEYAIDCARQCRAAGVRTVAVTAGYITPAAARSFYAFMDAANVDLKGFTEDFYRELTIARLAPVQETLKWLVRETEVWLEVTNLLIPGKNDSEEDLKRMSAWLVEALGPDVPLHFTAFHPDFRMRDVPPTPPATLIKAHEIARRAGLRYVYTGNLSDQSRQSTYCPQCGTTLVGRDGYLLTAYGLRGDRCRGCGGAIAGRFGDAPGDWGPRRVPIRIADFAVAKTPAPGASLLHDQGGPSQKATSPEVLPAAFSLTSDQERAIFQAAGRCLIAAVLGQAPPPVAEWLGDLARMPVAGAFVTVRRAGKLRGCCGSLGKSAPLSQAIEHAAIAAAKEDPRFPPIASVELPHLYIDVWLLGRLEPVLVKGPERKNAVIIGKHGLKISKGNLHGLLLPGVAVEHGLDAEGFLRQVCRKAGLPPDAWQDDDAALMTFEGRAIEGPLSIEMEIRLAVAAGTFYPRQAREIDRTLDEWFANGPQPEPWAGALVPHAGWVYSGKLAADVLGRVKFPQRVIVLAPRHRPQGAVWAVAPHRVWQLPGRCVDSDPALAATLAGAIAGLEADSAAHEFEHAIEVQLPLIARLAPQSRVVGITVHDGDLAALQRFGQQLAAVMASLDERPLLVVSSDMNHYAEEGETRRRDRMALEALVSMDPVGLYRVVRENRISMCGVMPAVVALTALGVLNALNRCCEVGYTTSAAASNDTRRCVGYAGLLFA